MITVRATAHCHACEWTAGPGGWAEVDKLAGKHAKAGHAVSTVATPQRDDANGSVRSAGTLRPDRIMRARTDGICGLCGAGTRPGQQIGRLELDGRHYWAHLSCIRDRREAAEQRSRLDQET